MTKYQQILQDVLHFLFSIAIMGLFLSALIKPAISTTAYMWYGIVCFGGLVFVYSMDSTFNFANPSLPTIPQLPPIAAGSTVTETVSAVTPAPTV
jgi:hypothetical protein